MATDKLCCVNQLQVNCNVATVYCKVKGEAAQTIGRWRVKLPQENAMSRVRLYNSMTRISLGCNNRTRGRKGKFVGKQHGGQVMIWAFEVPHAFLRGHARLSELSCCHMFSKRGGQTYVQAATGRFLGHSIWEPALRFSQSEIEGAARACLARFHPGLKLQACHDMPDA